MQRRRLLASVGTLVAGSFAGCLASGTADTPGNEPSRDGSPRSTPPTDAPSDDSPTPSDSGGKPSVTGSDVETVGAACKDDEQDGIEVAFGSTGVSIDGVATVPTPCHTATIEPTSIVGDRLRVRLGFEAGDGPCTQCVGVLTYAATIDLETAAGIESVEVTHGDDGETFTASRESNELTGSPGSPESPDSPGSPPESTYHAASDPDPDLAVYLENEHDAVHQVRVTIRREGGEAVYEETHEVAPGADLEIYNLREASPDGIESFTIAAAMDGGEESVTVETSTCYGPAIVSVGGEGELYPYYAVC